MIHNIQQAWLYNQLLNMDIPEMRDGSGISHVDVHDVYLSTQPRSEPDIIHEKLRSCREEVEEDCHRGGGSNLSWLPLSLSLLLSPSVFHYFCLSKLLSSLLLALLLSFTTCLSLLLSFTILFSLSLPSLYLYFSF